MKIKDLKNKLENISDNLFVLFEDENGVLRKLKDISIYEDYSDGKAYIYIERFYQPIKWTCVNNWEFNHKILWK